MGTLTSPKLREPFQIVRAIPQSLPSSGAIHHSDTPPRQTGPMAVVAVCEPRERADFSTLVLRGLVEIGHYEEELCLELGLSYWINHGEMRLDEAVPALLA